MSHLELLEQLDRAIYPPNISSKVSRCWWLALVRETRPTRIIPNSHENAIVGAYTRDRDTYRDAMAAAVYMGQLYTQITEYATTACIHGNGADIVENLFKYIESRAGEFMNISPVTSLSHGISCHFMADHRFFCSEYLRMCNYCDRQSSSTIWLFLSDRLNSAAL